MSRAIASNSSLLAFGSKPRSTVCVVRGVDLRQLARPCLRETAPRRRSPSGSPGGRGWAAARRRCASRAARRSPCSCATGPRRAAAGSTAPLRRSVGRRDLGAFDVDRALAARFDVPVPPVAVVTVLLRRPRPSSGSSGRPVDSDAVRAETVSFAGCGSSLSLPRRRRSSPATAVVPRLAQSVVIFREMRRRRHLFGARWTSHRARFPARRCGGSLHPAASAPFAPWLAGLSSLDWRARDRRVHIGRSAGTFSGGGGLVGPRRSRLSARFAPCVQDPRHRVLGSSSHDSSWSTVTSSSCRTTRRTTGARRSSIRERHRRATGPGAEGGPPPPA